jgi:hypothetical protein
MTMLLKFLIKYNEFDYNFLTFSNIFYLSELQPDKFIIHQNRQVY